MLATLLPWNSAAEHKRLMTDFDKICTFIVLTRDKDSQGRVWIDNNGEPRVDWKLSNYDAESMIQGLVAGIKVMIAAGAKEIVTLQHSVPVFKVPNVEKPLESLQVKQFLQKVEHVGIKVLYTGLFCAHQMGSCRMGANAAKGAVNSRGETFEIKNLYVADASLFPTASGANPMMTTFALAYSVAQFLKADLKMNAKL
jgi:choline dehydrogenase-like flavoprotein